MINVKRPTPIVQCLMPNFPCQMSNVNVNVYEVGGRRGNGLPHIYVLKLRLYYYFLLINDIVRSQ